MTRSPLEQSSEIPKVLISFTVGAVPYKFTGQERDSESDLDHFPARYYSSQMGRFMTPDPLGIFSADLTDPQTLNQYSYVRNNPLSMIDPTGTDGIGIGCDDYTCGDCFILCDVGISWGGGSSGPTSVWVPPDTAGTSSPGGSGTGGPDPNNPFSGETFGIPNGMRIPGMTLAEIFWLPNSPSLILDDTAGGASGSTLWLSTFLSNLFSWENIAAAQKDAWGKGYYSCLIQEAAGSVTAPLVTHSAEELVNQAIENTNLPEKTAGAYYHFIDGRFTAWGKYSKVLVPEAAETMRSVAGGLNVVGWGYFDYELGQAIHTCSGVLR